MTIFKEINTPIKLPKIKERFDCASDLLDRSVMLFSKQKWLFIPVLVDEKARKAQILTTDYYKY